MLLHIISQVKFMKVETYKQKIKNLTHEADIAWKNLRKVEDCKCSECSPLVSQKLNTWYKISTKRNSLIKIISIRLHSSGLNWSKIAKLLELDYITVFRQGSYGGKVITKNTKQLVKKRDKNRCQACKSKVRLQIHHIYDSKNHKKENLLTLCIPCHTFIEKFKRHDKETYELLIGRFYTRNCNS